MEHEAVRSWPRRRLQIRSVLSATLPVGWVWVAGTALIPYFLIGHGPGSSAGTMLGLTRATWLSLHVWSSISMGLLTVGHAILNRRGVGRSIRIVAGRPNPASSDRARGPGMARMGAIALILAVTVGGFAFAGVDDTHERLGEAGGGSLLQVDDGDHSAGGGAHRGNGRR